MGRMNCKFCEEKGIVTPIDYDKETKTATEVATGQKHVCPYLKKGGFPKKWTKKEAQPIELELEVGALRASLESLEKDVLELGQQLVSQGDAIKALVKELSFKKANGEDLDN